MAIALVLLALVGPPKLPPLPGRGLPPPEPPAATERPSKTEPPKEPPKTEPPTTEPKPQTTSAPPAVRAAPPPPPPAAVAPTLTPAALSETGSSMRVVGADELARWTEQTRRREAAGKPSATPKTATTRTDDDVVLRTASEQPPPERLVYRRRPHPPERSAAFVLGYRHFRIRDALDRAQDWHLASLEVTPLRRYFRLNLITEFGIESGPAARAGDRADMMLLERLGLGLQYPHFVTPLLEFQAGIGGARVELFQRNDLAFLYTFGVDAGAQWAVTRWMYLHAVIGWIRPTFRWPDRTAAYDRFTFKVGVGF